MLLCAPASCLLLLLLIDAAAILIAFVAVVAAADDCQLCHAALTDECALVTPLLLPLLHLPPHQRKERGLAQGCSPVISHAHPVERRPSVDLTSTHLTRASLLCATP